MKHVPVFLGFLAIAASGFAVAAKSETGRMKAAALPEPISIAIDQLALPENALDEFDESVVPDGIRKLNGKPVRIVGQRSIIGRGTQSTFVFSGYTRKPNFLELRVQHFIPITLKAGTTTSVGAQPIEVVGRFVIRPTYDNEGNLTRLYFIEEAVVRETIRPEGFHPSVLTAFLSPF